ncbi:ankyrin repeat-containing domain protein [Chaetomium tenue]|uniref:Ankyrin repeat-containing domain protein n=1 Tax=Chaetomium tenue TaxID=1854479 RepID=A0ACB7PIX7_9PEZI|nr:ankyrin repeat-containing domain protein [Chaetomium globosum]
MDNLSDVSIRQQPSSSVNSALHGPKATYSKVGNVHTDALARILCESGLASEEAALMSIVPAFLYHSKLPTLDMSMAMLLADAKKLRNDGQSEQAEAHLMDLIQVCSSDYQEKVVRALGELYRGALRSPGEFHRNFGLQGMADMESLWVHDVAVLSEAALRARKDYSQLSGFLNADTRHGGKPLKAKPLLMLDMKTVLDLRRDTALPRANRSRLKVLVMLEEYDIRDRNSLAVQELLFVAIELGYLEIIEELRALNASLLLERPSEEQSSPEPPSDGLKPLIAAAQQNFSPDGIVILQTETGEEEPHRTGSSVGFLAALWAARQLEEKARVPSDAEDVMRAVLDWASIRKDLTDEQKNTPLMYAASSGNLAAVDIMLECGVDLRARNTAGDTALSKAVANDRSAIAATILEKGQRAGGLTHDCLHHALLVASRLRKENFIKLLQEHGAGIEGSLDESDTGQAGSSGNGPKLGPLGPATAEG